MSLKHFSYSQDAEDSFALDNSSNLFVIRFRYLRDPLRFLYDWEELGPLLPKISLRDSFPESGVFIYEIRDNQSEDIRDLVISLVNKERKDAVEYIGKVKVFPGTRIYQIYTGNLFLKFKADARPSDIRRIFTTYDLRLKMELHFAPYTYFAEAPRSIGSRIFEFSLDILNCPEVEYCHPEMVVRPRSVPETGQTREKFNGEKNLWAFEKTGIPEAWKISRGKGIKIAVIDDGLDFHHPAFRGQGKIAAFRDMHDKTGNRLPRHQADEKHGTAVTGIAASNDPNVMGVAPDAQVIAVRATSLGSVLQSEAFYWAVKSGADVIACSWGPPDRNLLNPDEKSMEYPIPPHTDMALQYAARKGRNGKGCIVVFAAGNGNEPLALDKYASHPDVIAVGAVNYNDQPTVYSDYGPPLFCCFPSGDYEAGENRFRRSKQAISVTDVSGTAGYSEDNYYAHFTGTSASCPGVAGVAALILSANPALTRGQVKEIIKTTCKKIGNPEDYRGPDGESFGLGHGLVQADLAVKKAIKLLNIHTMKAFSLHIGINNVDQNYYGNNIPPLKGCINDMLKMESLAQKLGYTPQTLSDEKATRKNIRDTIIRLGKEAGNSGILLITYSGHGAPLTENYQETSGKDQAWVTYDGFLVDDQINECFCELPEDLRVILLSDSCFSGSISRLADPDDPFAEFSQPRAISFEQVKAVLIKNNQSLKSLISNKGQEDPDASVILISASTDVQYAYESDGEGLFTKTLLTIYQEITSSGKKDITYSSFKDLILARIRSRQEPQIKLTGKDNPAFQNQFPFSISGDPDFTASDPAPTPAGTQKKPKGFTNLLQHHADGTVTPLNPAYPDAGDQRGFAIDGKTEWDKAYVFATDHEGFVEPDNASNLFFTQEADSARGNEKYIPTYPDPGKYGSAVPAIWHLDDAHSQLLRARETVYNELTLGTKPDFSTQVKIAHIDTGYIPDHPSLPENLQPGFSVHFNGDQAYEGAEDYDATFAIGEQQGHGTATLAILAGRKVSIEGEFEGYFGAIPFARVISLKISETVALLSGRNFAAAVDYAIAHECDVITMSMAGYPTKIMAEAVNKAYEAGIVVVSAASNSFSQGLGSVLPKVTLYPARFDRVIGAVGAAINHAPYLVDLQERLRAAGGRYMQTCYGPKEALPTSLAAYTPNITWFNGDPNKNEAECIFTGGGTSSATPQIAAAAALYIQKYRQEINAAAGDQPWKKAEIVRQALFKSAFKATPYNYVYGNGILRAADALKDSFSPSQIAAGGLTQARKAEVSGGIFKRLFKIYRGKNGKENPEIQKMLELELFQLLHRDPQLTRYLENIPQDSDFNILQYPNLPELIDDVRKSPMASGFILKHLVEVAGDTRTAFRSRGSDPLYKNYSMGTYTLSAAGISCYASLDKKDVKVAQCKGVMMDEITLEIGGLASRGNVPEDLTLSMENEDLQMAVLTEAELDGKIYYEWSVPGAGTSETARGIYAADEDPGLIRIHLHPGGSAGERNIWDKGKRLVLKVFKWIKPKIADKITDKIKLDFLASLGDSRYELLEFNKDTNQWEEAKNTNGVNDALLVMPGLLGNIDKGFTDFFSNPEVQQKIKARRIFGFNMPTLVQGIEQNARELQKVLKKENLNGKISTVLTRSRGGIVARYAIEHLKVEGIQRLIMVAPPNEGTPMASSENWKKLLDTATNVANLAFGSYVPILPKITAILKAIANKFVDLPGINDLEIQDSVVSKMNAAGPDISAYYVVISNFTPDSWLKKIWDRWVIDKLIFKNVPNDCVVPTAGAVFQQTNTLPAGNYLPVKSADAVNHFSYLNSENTEIIKWVCNKL